MPPHKLGSWYLVASVKQKCHKLTPKNGWRDIQIFFWWFINYIRQVTCNVSYYCWFGFSKIVCNLLVCRICGSREMSAGKVGKEIPTLTEASENSSCN